jgi:hypothetical protein
MGFLAIFRERLQTALRAVELRNLAWNSRDERAKGGVPKGKSTRWGSQVQVL